ncbi:titin-like isoform X2 [Branchiostoma floridae]|uniref:Titin-like isoform X2 n=1 Tax=Branchiostoma floridae TaxID=7739 RepID=A0A9J7KRM6_BRAFL|nr:titin-like isoform X2 [Branchiostoma floridae]
MAGATNLQWVLSALFPNPRVYMDVNQRGLICPVCNDQFKSPLTLPCLHSVCRKCAEEILVSRENERNVTSGRYTPVSEPRSVLKCPACKKEVPLDSRGLDGLTENFILRNIIDSMQEAKEYSELDDDLGVQCDVCQEEPPNLATKTCVKCELCYCEECLNLTHPPGRPLTGHQLIAPTRDPKSNIVRCQEHNEIISLYCEDDDTVVCPTCHARSHKGHKVIPTDEKYRQMKAALKDSVKSLVNVNSTYVQHIGKLRSVCDGIQGHFDKQEGSVKKEFSDVKALVQKKEKDMLTTIEKERREKVEVRQQQIDHYRRTLENTTAAVSFAQEALRERGQASFLQKANMIDKKVKSALDSAPPIQDTELTEMPDNLFEANLDLADIASVINNKASVSKAPPPPEIRKSQCIVGESSISIRWHVPDPSVYKDYQVQYSTLPDVVRSTSRTSERLAVLESLSPGTTYTCTVRARDKDGTIHCSKPVDFKTKEPVATRVVKATTSEATSSSAARLASSREATSSSAARPVSSREDSLAPPSEVASSPDAQLTSTSSGEASSSLAARKYSSGKATPSSAARLASSAEPSSVSTPVSSVENDAQMTKEEKHENKVESLLATKEKRTSRVMDLVDGFENQTITNETTENDESTKDIPVEKPPSSVTRQPSARRTSAQREEKTPEPSPPKKVEPSKPSRKVEAPKPNPPAIPARTRSFSKPPPPQRTMSPPLKEDVRKPPPAPRHPDPPQPEIKGKTEPKVVVEDPNAPARVTSFLTDLEVRGLADAKFTCAITRPASEVQAKWSCDDNVITPSSKYEMTHEGKTLTLIVHNVQSSDTGEYACEVDDSKTCAQLSIKEPALPAINIQKCEVEDNAIIVRWNVPEDEKYDNFQLLYSKSFQSVGNRFLESSIFKTVNNIKETECKVLGLSPDSHYRFYVRSTTEWGLSQRSSGVLLRTLKKVPPPSFYRQLISLSVSEKDSARFSCELSRPVPVKWLKNDKPIPEDPRFKVEVDRRRHVLTITDIKADDAGEYSCDTGSTRSSASLKVKAEPATFIKPLKDVEVVRHGKATLECEVSRDDAKVRWLKSGMDVLQNTKHDLKQNGCLHQLIISDVRLDDASEYACEVVQGNGSPTGVRSTAKLKIRAINHSVPGTPEIIADESTVTPNSVTLVWKDPDPSNGDVYHVLYAKFYGQSSGRYKTISGVKERQCTVSNLEPDTKYKFYVRAVDKAGISRGVVIATSPPDDGGVQFQKILRDEEVFSKETATFECQLSAPNAEVKWLRNSVQIHSSGKYKIEEDGNRMTHRLIVNNCGKEDVAEYTCQCGINKTTASLRVKESQGPEILSDKCKIESDSITLYWTTPTLSTFRTYQVLYATSFGPNVTDNYDYQTLSDIRTTFCRIPALQADTTYKFYVRGVTKDGISRPSRGVELTTQPEGRRSRLRTRARSEENLSRALSPSAQKKRLSFNFKDFISDSAPGLTRKDPGINMSDVLRNYVSPFFKKGLVSTMVKIGSEVRFECSIGGFPNPMVIWEKDGREIRQDYRHKLIRESEELFTLVIFRARAEDSGTYEVVATNEAGERRSSATLGVTELESVNEVGSSPVPPPRRRGRISAPIFGDVREKVGQFERGAKRYESFRERRQPTPPEVTESNLRRSQSTEMLSHHQRSKVSAPLSWLKKQLRSSLADDELKDDKEERESKPSKARSFFGSLRKTHSTSRF